MTKIFVFAYLSFSAGALVCATAPNVPVLVAGRAIQGIGAALVTAAMAWLHQHNISRIELGVLANNADAVMFWTKQGFQTFRLVMHKQMTESSYSTTEKREQIR